MSILIAAATPEMDRTFQTRSLPSIWHRCLLKIASMHLILSNITIAGKISQRKHIQYPHINILVFSHHHIFMTPAMSRQIIVSPFNSHTLSYWPNIPAPSTFAPQQARIKRSRLFSQSLFGRAGLLRQIGASDDHSAVTRAWAESLNYENNVTFPTGPNFYNSRSDFVTSMVYDEYTRSIIAGAELYEYEGGRDRSSLCYPPSSPSSEFELTYHRVVASKDSDRSYFRAKKRERVAPSKVDRSFYCW